MAILTVGLVLLFILNPWFLRAGESRPGGELKAGVFLYAVPELPDLNFFHTVILLVTYDEDGAMGLVINRPSEVHVNEALPDFDSSIKFQQPLYIGGPVSRDRMSVFIRSDDPPDDALKVLENVFLSWSREVLDQMLKKENPENILRVYSGYAGWSPGQLDREFARGDWVIGRAEPDKIFIEDTSSLWPEIFKIREQVEVRNPIFEAVPASFSFDRP